MFEGTQTADICGCTLRTKNIQEWGKCKDIEG